MSDGHYREVCECGTVIKQCRCFHAGNRLETVGICSKCRAAWIPPTLPLVPFVSYASQVVKTPDPPVLMWPADPIVCEAVAIQLAKLPGTWAQASMDANRKTAEAVLSALGLAGFNIYLDGRS